MSYVKGTKFAGFSNGGVLILTSYESTRGCMMSVQCSRRLHPSSSPSSLWTSVVTQWKVVSRPVFRHLGEVAGLGCSPGAYNLAWGEGKAGRILLPADSGSDFSNRIQAL